MTFKSFTTLFSWAWLLKPSLRVHMEGVRSGLLKAAVSSGLAGGYLKLLALKISGV
jgi:hypothetical protein